MLEIPKDYYSDSLNEVEFEEWLFRTEGSAQIQFWGRSLNLTELKANLITHRRYFRGKYRDKMVFVKQFLKPNLPNWTIKESVEYQFQNLFLFRVDWIPRPIFLTDDAFVMEYIEGDTVKNLVLQKRLDRNLGDNIIKQLKFRGQHIVNILESHGRKYDCSYNNILVRKNGQIVFVDFDYANKPKGVEQNVQIIMDLSIGKASFDNQGHLCYENKK